MTPAIVPFATNASLALAWFERACAWPAFELMAAARLARTCRLLADAWRRHVLVFDMPRRLRRFYRGASLRHCVTVLRTNEAWFEAAAAAHNVELLLMPRAPAATSDAACVEETVRFGLAADADELAALECVGLISPLDAERLAALSRDQRRAPERAPSTRARALVPIGDSVIVAWRHFAASGQPPVVDIVCGRAPPLDWHPSVAFMADGDGAPPQPTRLVYSERVRAHARLVCARLGVGAADYEARACTGRLDAVPQLVERYCSGGAASVAPCYGDPDADALAVSVAELARAMFSALFAFRARPRRRDDERDASRMPASIDASRAWLFETLNGPIDWRVRARDELAAAPLWRRERGVEPQLTAVDLAGFYASARRYLDGDVHLAPSPPPPPPPPRLPSPRFAAGGHSTWFATIVPSNCDARLRALRKAIIETRRLALLARRGVHGGVVLGVSCALALPAPLYVDFSPAENALVVVTPRHSFASSAMPATALRYVEDMLAARPVLLATIDYVHYYDHFVVRWSAAAMALSPTGRPLRCRLAEALGVVDTPTPAATTWRRAPRCASCSRMLVDAQSILAGRGPRCRRSAACSGVGSAPTTPAKRARPLLAD